MNAIFINKLIFIGKKIIRLTENELHKIVEQIATQVIDTMTSFML